MNEIKIDIPEGMEIDEKNSTFTLIKFKKKENKLPESWEELGKIYGHYITSLSNVDHASCASTSEENKNIFPTKELAEAALALAQLLQLRDAYNNSYKQGWTPDWHSHEIKYVIRIDDELINTTDNICCQGVLTFPTPELRNKFLSCPKIKELLEIAKPLI